MDAAKQSSLSSFKSKKLLHSPAPSDRKVSDSNPFSLKTPGKSSDRKVSNPNPNPNPFSVKTPGKPADPPRRLRNRGVALSISDIRKAAQKLREPKPDPVPSNDPFWRTDEVEVTKPKKSAASAIKLPEKYELLEEFFNNLLISIRLLRMRDSPTTFTNISSQIEVLTERRFTHNHLAKLKFLMPETIKLEKCLQHDERTSCMKPDLRIELDESIEIKGKSEAHSVNLKLKKVFRSQLLDFFKKHPKGDEVPEHELPEPFSRSKENTSANSAQPSGTASVGERRQGAEFSHMSPSFKRSRFTLRSPVHQVEKLKEEQPFFVSAHSSVISEDKFAGSSSGKEVNEIAMVSASEMCSSYEATLPETPVKCAKSVDDEDECSHVMASVFKTPVGITSTPVKLAKSVDDEDECSDVMASVFKTPVRITSTPVKLAKSVDEEDECSDVMASVLKTPVEITSTPVKLMSATPTQRPNKRCYMSPDSSSCAPPSKLVRRPPPNRPLKFETPVKKSVKFDDVEFGQSGNSSTQGDISSILPQSLIQSIQEKERLALLEKDPAISQAIRRRKMLACLPKLFDRVYFYFQSIRRSVVTKEQLMHTLISQLDVVDKKDVEEQLRLLQELAPEWIYEKSGMSGDLFCVNKILNAAAMRTRLSEAI